MKEPNPSAILQLVLRLADFRVNMQARRFIFPVFFCGLLSAAVPCERLSAQEGPAPRSIVKELKRSSRDALDSLGARDSAGFLKSIEGVVALRDEAGCTSIDELSAEILGMAASGEAAGLEGQIMADAAVKTSPNSVRTAFSIFSAADLFGLLEASMRLGRALLLDPSALGLFMARSLRPILWAAVLSLQAAFVILFAARPSSLLSRISGIMPTGFRDSFGPPLAIALAAAPLSLPPMICLVLWGVVALLAFPKLRSPAWIVFGFGAACLALLPASERAERRFGDEEFISIMGTLSGDWAPEELAAAKKFVGAYPASGTGFYALGEAAKRAGDLELARSSFASALERLPNAAEPQAALAVVEYLAGNSQKAKSLMDQVFDAGFKSVETYFAASLILFDLGDTEGSRHSVDLARARDRRRLEALVRMEEIFGSKAPGVVPSPRLPRLRLLPLSPELVLYGLDRDGDGPPSRGLQIFWGGDGRGCPAAALLALLIAIIATCWDRRLPAASRPDYQPQPAIGAVLRFLPGGAAIEESNFARGAASLIAFAVLCLACRGMIIPKSSGVFSSLILPGALALVLLGAALRSFRYFRSWPGGPGFDSGGGTESSSPDQPADFHPLLPPAASIIILLFGLAHFWAGLSGPLGLFGNP